MVDLVEVLLDLLRVQDHLDKLSPYVMQLFAQYENVRLDGLQDALRGQRRRRRGQRQATEVALLLSMLVRV